MICLIGTDDVPHWYWISSGVLHILMDIEDNLYRVVLYNNLISTDDVL